MAKWNFSYSTSEGKRGHIKVTAANKIDAIKKGIEHAKKHATTCETVTSWNVTLTQA